MHELADAYESGRLHAAAAQKTDEPEELVHQAVTRAADRWDQYEEGTDCVAWLVTILYRICAAQKRRPDHVPTDLTEREDALYTGRMPEGREGFSDQLVDQLKALRPAYRHVLLLCGLHDFSYKEAAYILDRPEGTIMTWMHRARKEFYAD